MTEQETSGKEGEDEDTGLNFGAQCCKLDNIFAWQQGNAYTIEHPSQRELPLLGNEMI